MEAQLIESNTVPSQEYTQSFFHKVPTDSRFIKNTFKEVMPTSSIDGRVITFDLPKFEAANIYQIQDTYVKVQCKITKQDGSLPDISKKPSTVNNLLHSLFESVRISINDKLISTASKDYPYKAYISTTLTYPSTCKHTWLHTQGYYPDIGRHMGPVDQNTGFSERHGIFREHHDASQNYKSDGTILFGKLQHELMSITTGIPPGNIF